MARRQINFTTFMSRFATLLLDLDGTLVDAFTTIHRSYCQVLPHFGRPAPTIEQVRRAVGGGLENAMRHFLPEELIAEGVRRHIAHTDSILLEDVKLLPGAMALLRAQHDGGVTLAAFTNKRGDHSRKANLVEYGFRLPSALDNRPLKFEEFEHMLRQTVFVSATPADYERENAGQVVEQVVRPTGLVDPDLEVRPAATQVDDLLSEIGLRVARDERVLVTTLTKRMAEQLTDYLRDHGVKVRYLHSEIETVERVEIIRDLRLGEFDVLVGINLLREGLDLPEVSLVAILDADKEGFLRSERSLIQTIGRAARHLHGKAILYGDRVTDSMKRAMQETERRRHKQLAHNDEHSIQPIGISKKVKDIIDGVYDADQLKSELMAAEESARYEAMSEKQVAREIKKLEKEMLEHAKNLEFEKAAALRDRLAELKRQVFGASGQDHTGADR